MSAANANTHMPATAKPAKQVSDELGIPYPRLRYWWTMQLIGSWRVGKFRYLVPEEVSAFQKRVDTPRYVGPRDHANHTDTSD